MTSPEAEFAYLEAAFEDGDPSLIAAAIGDIAGARGMAQIAKAAGLSRETVSRRSAPRAIRRWRRSPA
ncbi:MAG: addiction module antidote protein [Roseiarcus sp.]